jgi:3-oxoisoapionate decarboxylase
MIDAVRPHERGVNSIIEHWLPWQGDSETTCALEDRWTLSNLHYLRSRES